MTLVVVAGAGSASAKEQEPATPATGPAPPPGMVYVPPGPFTMGDAAGQADEAPVRRVHLQGFFMDSTEVTRGAYEQCVAARVCRPPKRYGDPTSPRHPVVGVSWFDAMAYCRFVSKRLPTEAEWEKAARGPDGRRYPWGDRADCRAANYGNFQGEGACGGTNPGHPVAVGSYPSGRSPYGADDLGGNVWEWVNDWYRFDYYRRAPGRNPRGPRSGEGRGLRGGACCSMFLDPRAANRLRFVPSYRDADIGFRCARDVHPRGRQRAGTREGAPVKTRGLTPGLGH